MTNDELEAIRARDAACAVPKTVISEVQWVVSNADRRALLSAYDALRLQLADIESQNRVMWDVASDREAQLAEAEVDARRYRWLVNCNDAGVWAFLAGMDDDQIDEAIDKWLAASETESGTHKQE